MRINYDLLSHAVGRNRRTPVSYQVILLFEKNLQEVFLLGWGFFALCSLRAEQPSLLFVFRRFHAVCWAVCFVGGFGLEGFGIMPHRHGRLFGSMYSTDFFFLDKERLAGPFCKGTVVYQGFFGCFGVLEGESRGEKE